MGMTLSEVRAHSLSCVDDRIDHRERSVRHHRGTGKFLGGVGLGQATSHPDVLVSSSRITVTNIVDTGYI